MLSLQEALLEDAYPAVCPPDQGGDDDPFSGWDLDVFPEVDLRPELRLFAGAPPDLAVRCRGGRVLAAHRAVLAEASYFEALFNGNFCERGAESLEVDEEPEVFFELLRWIYCHDASVDKDIVLDIFRLADIYGLDDLVEHCSRALAALDLGGLRATADAEEPAGAEEGGRRGGQKAAVPLPWPAGSEGAADLEAAAGTEVAAGARLGTGAPPAALLGQEGVEGPAPGGDTVSVRLPKAKDL